MHKNVKTVIFDLDGTVYQNTTFHRDYLHFLVEDTAWVNWEAALIEFVDSVFAGKRLVMNRFYQTVQVKPETPDEFFAMLEESLCPPLSYEEALNSRDIIYLGDAWAVVTLIGETLGLLAGERRDLIYRRARRRMEEEGMGGSIVLKTAISDLSKRCNVILMSNSYEETAQEFLRQLGYNDLFPLICSSANKPFDMIRKLEQIDPAIFEQPETVISIGDHAYNDLMPIQQKGGRTVWLNPFPNIERPVCDVEVETLDELAGYLTTLTGIL